MLCGVRLHAAEGDRGLDAVGFEPVPYGVQAGYEVGEADHAVAPRGARLRAGMGVGAEAACARKAKTTCDRRDDANRRASRDQPRPLLDVDLDESGDCPAIELRHAGANRLGIEPRLAHVLGQRDARIGTSGVIDGIGWKHAERRPAARIG